MARPLINPAPLDRVLLRAAVIGALAAAIVLAGCGRKGPLEPPPSAQAAAPVDATGKPRPLMTPDGRPIAPPGGKQRIPLDWLID